MKTHRKFNYNKAKIKRDLVIDLNGKYKFFIDKLGSKESFLKWLKTNFNFDKYPYEGYSKRGLDDHYDLNYDIIRSGDRLLHNTGQMDSRGWIWEDIVVLSKTRGIITYARSSNNEIDYIDCIDNPNLNIHLFLPYKYVVPDYVSMEDMHLPDKCELELVTYK